MNKKTKLKNQTINSPIDMPVYVEHSVQVSPLLFVLSPKEKFEIKIEAVWLWTGYLLVAGWTSAACTFQIRCGTVKYDPCVFFDCEEKNSEHIPFALILPRRPEMDKGDIQIGVTVSILNFRQAFPLQVDTPETWRQHAKYFSMTLAYIAGKQKLFSPEWHMTLTLLQKSSSPCPTAAGSLDYVLHTAWNHSAIVTGWYSATSETQLWLQHDNGKMWSLDTASWRYFRSDVQKAIGNTYHCDSNHAFVAAIDDVPAWGYLHMNAISNGGSVPAQHTLCSVQITNCGYDILTLAEKAFLPTIVGEDFIHPATQVFIPVISDCMQKQTVAWDSLDISHHTVGTPPDDPLISIIIYLCDHHKYVDYQLADFRTDRWFMEHCELVYVVDDPEIVLSFQKHVSLMYYLYKVPFRWVWGHTKRGYSGANNLGVKISQAQTLLFLKNDVLPCSSGWTQNLYELLHASSDTGAVGACLLRSDGSVRHAGGDIHYIKISDVLMNEYPHAESISMVDPHQTAIYVPFVSGACLAIRKSHFYNVGGWSSGYLLGDFEETDLCLKLHAQGFTILYDPDTCLTYLKQQASKLSDNSVFQQHATRYSAILYQQRWGKQLTPLSSHHGGARS